MTKQLKPQVGPTGLRKWQLPDSELSIVWAGPGSRLLLCVDKPGGLVTNIESAGSEGSYDNAKQAQLAVDIILDGPGIGLLLRFALQANCRRFAAWFVKAFRKEYRADRARGCASLEFP